MFAGTEIAIAPLKLNLSPASLCCVAHFVIYISVFLMVSCSQTFQVSLPGGTPVVIAHVETDSVTRFIIFSCSS